LKLNPDGPPRTADDFATRRCGLRASYLEVIYGGGFDFVPLRSTALNLTCDAGVRHAERSDAESKGDGRTEAQIPMLTLHVPTIERSTPNVTAVSVKK